MGQKKKWIILLAVVVLVCLGIGAFAIFKPGFLGSTPSVSTLGMGQESFSGDKAVSLFFPSGAIDNLDQTVLVSFAQPMVSLTTLDQQVACPLAITPSTDGTCRRISSQTIEFTPKQRKPATQYTVIVTGTTDTYTGTFSTPLLQRGIGQKESLREGIQLIFNFPVKDGQLQQYLLVTDTKTNKKISINVVADTMSGVYTLQPQAGMWNYLTTYTFALSAPLDTQDGNLPSTLSGLVYTTLDALTDVILQKLVVNGDQKGFESYRYHEGNNEQQGSSEGYGYGYDFGRKYATLASSASLLPLQNIAFDMVFQEKITDLSPTLIRLVKDGVAVPATLSYVPEMVYNEQTRTEHQETTKHKVRVVVTGKLTANSTYQLIYTPDGKTIIASRTYKTPAPLQVTRIEMVEYSKVCLYTNNQLDQSTLGGDADAQTVLTTVPKSRVQYIGQGEYIPENLAREFAQLSNTTTTKFLTDKGFCPQPKPDEVVYAINTRLNPSTSYTLNFTVKDIYGTTLAPITKTFVTSKMKDKDKFIYMGYPDKNTIPSNVPLIVNIQSINTSSANISVCGMNVEKYLASQVTVYDESGNQILPESLCNESFTKDITIKNNNRILSNTRIDLEKDLGGKIIQSPIVRVVGSLSAKSPTSNKGFSTLFLRSNLSLMLENGTNKKIMLATAFDGTPISGLSFKGYSFGEGGYTPVGLSAKYDATQGVYILSETADIIVASNKTYRGMMESQTDITENYDFGYIAGQGSYEKDFLYMYTERPLYKPGDTVYYKGILRAFSLEGFKTSKKTAGNIIINNELGEEIMKLTVKLDKNSNFTGSFVLPKDINLGGYSMRFQTPQEDIYTNAMFVVEEYHKPVFKITIDSGTNDIIAGDTATMSLNPVYYFGGKITNAQGNYQILTQKYFFNAKDYSDFQFGEGNDYVDCLYRNECRYMDTPIYAQDAQFTINPTGNYTLKYPTDKESAEKLYSFTFQVEDPTTKRPVSTTVSKVIHATDGYVGIQLPYRNTKDQGIVLNAVTLDWDAEPKPNTSVTIKLIKQDWKAIKKQGIDGVFYYDYSLEQVTESTQNVTSDNKGLIEKTLSPKTDGEYLVTVSYQGKGTVPFVSSQTVYVSGEDPLIWRTENNSVTKVIAEKTMVNIGDTANYTIQSPINTGTIFIAVEKDDGILKYLTLPLQSYATKFSLKITKEYYPNIYLRVFLIGQQANNTLPIYKRGLAISKVNTLPQKLKVEITTNKQLYLPGDAPKITVKVTDADGAPVVGADLSIGIVDQSLLALKGNPLKNPFAYFYDMKRYLGTYTWVSLNTLVDKLEIKDATDGSKGGDGNSLKGGNSRKKRGVFKDTAYRNANLTTDAQGQVSVIADALPDNLTTWVIESLVNTKDTKIGIATNTIQTALPLMISPNLPNILSLNDKVVFHPVIFNKTDKEQSVAFTMSGTYLSINNPTQKITIPAQGQIAVNVTALVTGENLLYTQKSASKIQLIATTADADIRDEMQIYIPVVQNLTKETVTTVGNISGGKAIEQLDIAKKVQGYLTMTYSKSLFGSLLEGISGSSQSAYACLEQRFSSFMSHVYIKKLFVSAQQGDKYNFEKIFFSEWVDQFDGYKKIALPGYIKSQLASLEKYQNTDGGFMFRYDTTLPQKSSVWLTNYIISSLAALRDIGYTVPEKVSTTALEYLKIQFYADQKRCVQNKSTCAGWVQQGMDTIAALVDFTPSESSVTKMWELVSPYTQDTQSVTLSLKKAIVLGKLGQQKEVTDILTTVLKNQLVMEPKTAHIGKYTTYGNALDTAYFLEASTYAPELMTKNTVIYDALQRWIAEQKKNGAWGSTQETIEVIKSLTRFIATNPVSSKRMNITTMIGSDKFPELTLPKDDPFVITSFQTDMAKVAHQSKITMQSDAKDTAYYDITMNYFLPAKDVASRDEGFVIQKKYYSYESYMNISRQKNAERNEYMQNKISYTALKYPKAIATYLQEEKAPKVGEVLVVNIDFVTSEPRQQVAIDHYIPAGTELINPNLATESTYTNKRQNTNEQNGYGYGYQGSYDQEQQSTTVNIQTFTCDKEEFRTEKHFCYVERLNPGAYTLMSLIRVTHAGNFAVRPTMIFEFYHPENFGRTFGQQFIVAE